MADVLIRVDGADGVLDAAFDPSTDTAIESSSLSQFPAVGAGQVAPVALVEFAANGTVSRLVTLDVTTYDGTANTATVAVVADTGSGSLPVGTLWRNADRAAHVLDVGAADATYRTAIVQTAAGAPVDARPPTAEVPNGYVAWSLFDAPGTVDGPDDVESLDLVFNISGTAW